jgi:hypothetical protein
MCKYRISRCTPDKFCQDFLTFKNASEKVFSITSASRQWVKMSCPKLQDICYECAGIV